MTTTTPALTARQRLRSFWGTLTMPPVAGGLIFGTPIAILAVLFGLHAEHVRVAIDAVYYPAFIVVYALWVGPILAFALCSRRLDPHPAAPPKRSFLCLIPAYNEAAVIANPVRSLLDQEYPAELFEVYVVFDGTDQTGRIAEDLGSKVIVTPTNGYGKHRALDYAFRTLLRDDDDRYVVVVDADNQVSPNFLAAMNNAIEARGFRCLQAFHNVLNGSANWITKALWCSCVASSRLYLTGRMRSLSNALICGTGWCCDAQLLRQHWSQIKTQTEDIELNGLLALEHGLGVGYVPEASIYDEKPLHLWVAIRQRMRWMCGHTRVAYFYFFRCLYHGLIRRDAALLELAAYYLVPFALLTSFVTWPLLLGMSLHVFTIGGPLADKRVQIVFECLSLFFIFGYQLVGFSDSHRLGPTSLVRARRRIVYSLYTIAFSILAWPPALIWAMFSLAKTDWIFHTPHVGDANETLLASARAATLTASLSTDSPELAMSTSSNRPTALTLGEST